MDGRALLGPIGDLRWHLKTISIGEPFGNLRVVFRTYSVADCYNL